MDDWYSKPSEQYVGEKFGEITVDGAKYSIHAFLRQQEPSKSGTSTFVQFFSFVHDAEPVSVEVPVKVIRLVDVEAQDVTRIQLLQDNVGS